MTKPNAVPSKLRKRYFYHLLWRIAMFIMTVVLCFLKSKQFLVMEGMNFFKKFTVYHILWALYMLDMFLTLIPCRKHIPLGSQKFQLRNFKPLELIQPQKLLNYIKKCNKDTLKIGVAWLCLLGGIAALYFSHLISNGVLMAISMFFTVCDLICVLYWCPFRVLFMKNRCCTTCRIFNWDHLMRFSPLIFVPGFFSVSLFVMSLAVFLVWEIAFALHPERFYEGTNSSLQCANCTDFLCGKRNCLESKFNLIEEI